jgi:hypothetical protein
LRRQRAGRDSRGNGTVRENGIGVDGAPPMQAGYHSGNKQELIFCNPNLFWLADPPATKNRRIPIAADAVVPIIVPL